MDKDDWRLIGGCLGIMIGAMLFITLLIMAAAYGTSRAECANMTRLYSVETDVTLSLGCLVKHQGEWVVPGVLLASKLEITQKGK